jgi:Mrp family chromosome partitioning ATPase
MSSRRGDKWGRGGGVHDPDDDFHHPDDYHDTDPDLASQRARREAVRPSTALVAQRRRSLLVPESGTPVAARLPNGMASAQQLDSFRELRQRLLAMAQSLGLDHFTTLVVPLQSGSGASFIARNLAAAFTLEDGRISMLVDCNLRHPTQHLSLGARLEDGGLFDYLDSPHPALERLVRPTGIPGLHLIPAGRPANPHREYFSSEAMRMVMAALRSEPCYVFLDGPSAKGAPDARIISELVDFIVLVVGYGRDTADEIAAAASLFDPAKFAGVVFNERE